MNSENKLTDKDQIILSLNRLLRRVTCRSESRVNSSLFFHLLYSLLDELNNWNEEKLESELEKGMVKFVSFQPPFKISMTVELKKIEL